jgi:hypothetical protein
MAHTGGKISGIKRIPIRPLLFRLEIKRMCTGYERFVAEKASMNQQPGF